MKIEIVKETQFGKDPWYTLAVGETHVTGSWNLSTIEKLYDQIVENPDQFFERRTEILKSTEISLNLQS